MTFYVSLAILAFTAAIAISSWQPFPDSLFHLPRDEHLVATNESTPHSLLRGTNAAFHPPVLRQMTAESSKPGLIEYQPSNQFTITLHVFLVDTAALMDDQSRNIFEATALNFIVDNIGKLDLPLRSISDIKVVDQRLTWTRLEGESTTGIDVSFDADATVSDSVEELQLEAAIQLLFDSKGKAFRRRYDLALLGGPSDEPETTSESISLEAMRVPLGLSITAAGALSFIVILCVGAYHVNKKETEERNLSMISTIEADNKAVAGDQKAVQGQHTFPIQQAIVRLDDNVSSSSYHPNLIQHCSNEFDQFLITISPILRPQASLTTC